MRLHFLFALALSLFAIPAAAAAKGDTCTSARAEPASITAVQKDYPAWAGHCVRLRGIAFDRALLIDREAMLESRDDFGKQLQRSLVILPGSIWRKRGPLLVEIVGTIGSCKTANDWADAEEQRSGEIIMIGGYCHTSLANFVSPVAVRILSRAPILRFVEAEVPPAERPLVEAPAGLAGLNDHVAAARAMAEAFAARNETAFRRLFSPDVQHDIETSGGDTRSDEVREGVREAHAAFLALTSRGGAFATFIPAGHPQIVLLERAELDFAKEDRGAPSGYLVCWCKTAECAGRWPVLLVDADNDPARPYLCVRTATYTIYREGEVIQVEPGRRPRGFAEPAWPGRGRKPSG
jgi:hypothetical protein